MVARATRAELLPRAVFVLARDASDAPVTVHHLMRLSRLVLDADTELCPAFESILVTIKARFDRLHRLVEHRELHSAGDIDAHGVRNNGVFTSQNASDRQAVANVGIRHKGCPNGTRN